MPILNGFQATERIRVLEQAKNPPGSHPLRRSHQINGHIPIFAVSASLLEQQRIKLIEYGLDGWILKPINFNRLRVILHGATDPLKREGDVYRPGCNWEAGGWLRKLPTM
jgi:CheY-like chemotaxis protein